MDNITKIFWFSGTGNSLYAAKRLAAEMRNVQLAQITDEAPIGAVGGKGEKIGFVFPSYYGNLPRAVFEFISRAKTPASKPKFTLAKAAGRTAYWVGVFKPPPNSFTFCQRQNVKP